MSTSNVLRPTARRLLRPSGTHNFLPGFLISPILGTPAPAAFSTSSSTLNTKPTRDNNRLRGVSTQRRTGLREPNSVSKKPLPKPVLDPAKRSKIEVDPDHGLWGFFHNKDKPMNTPDEDDAHGRPWSVEELRGKTWEELHALWWVCCKERNRISTEAHERERLEAGYGEYESEQRDDVVKKTQRAIKHVLTERYYAWQDAEKLARTDAEVNLSGQGPAYTPEDYFEQGMPEDAMEAEAESEAEPSMFEEPTAEEEVIKESPGANAASERSELKQETVMLEQEVKQEHRPNSNA